MEDRGRTFNPGAWNCSAQYLHEQALQCDDKQEPRAFAASRHLHAVQCRQEDNGHALHACKEKVDT